jgi:tRNA 2-thiocytidine biosynthesis protein TtcA
MFYAGEISTMLPAQELFNGRFKVIRPLAYAEEALIRRFARDWNLPVFENRCPTSGRSMRAGIKRVLVNLYRSNPKIKGNIFRAMRRVKTDYLLK